MRRFFKAVGDVIRGLIALILGILTLVFGWDKAGYIGFILTLMAWILAIGLFCLLGIHERLKRALPQGQIDDSGD